MVVDQFREQEGEIITGVVKRLTATILRSTSATMLKR